VPSSYPGFLPQIITWAREAKPRTVADLGVGFGKLGALLREYLDVFCAENYGREHWKTLITGVEIHEPYIMAHQQAIYDRIYIMDVLKFMRDMGDARYDLIVCCDVLEHFQREEGEELLRLMRQKSKTAILTVPIGPRWKQGAVFENEHEAHLAVWEESDFTDATDIIVHTFNNKPIALVRYVNVEV
jgi:hypothetical protein